MRFFYFYRKLLPIERYFMKLVTAIFLLLLISLSGFTVNRENCSKTTKGTDFWLGFMESRNYNRVHELKMIVSATETTTFRITYGNSEAPFNSVYRIEADSTIEITLPWQMFEAIGSEKVQNKGIHLVSQKPVSVYAANWDTYSNDIALIYPVDMLGKTYFAMCYTPYIDPSNPETGGGRNSEFLVVATENNTTVSISPSKITDGGIPKDAVFEVILQKGEVYQVQSENMEGSGKAGQGDLTGSKVTADKPVAFFSGSLSTTVPYGSCCWDHLFEQVLPVHFWGKKYLTIPLKTRLADRYRILASQDKTTVFLGQDSVFYLKEGEFREFEFSGVEHILSDKPLLVAQFSQSLRVDSAYANGNGDPFMTILNPVGQWTNQAVYNAFISPSVESDSTYYGVQQHFVNLLTPASETGNITLDELPVNARFSAIPGSEYAMAQIETTGGTHKIESTGETGFQAYVYGFGEWESYGFAAGFNTDVQLDLGGNIEFFKKDTLLLCFGDTLKLDIGEVFNKINWNTGETSPTIRVAREGLFFVEAETESGCVLNDSVFVMLSHPKTNFGEHDVVACEPYAKKLDGGAGMVNYSWEDETGNLIASDRYFTARETGEYRLTATNRFRCETRDTFQLTILPTPAIKIIGDPVICSQLSTTLEVSITGKPDSLWNLPGNYSWFVNDPRLILTEPERFSAKIDAPEYGDYTVFYQLTTINNCVVTDTFKIRFHPMPVAAFQIDDVAVCNNYNREIKFTGSATGTAQYIWDLGGRQILDTLGWQHYLISVGVQTDNTSISLEVDDRGCISRFSGELAVSPVFKMESDVTRGCDSLTATFNAEVLVPEIVDFTWSFSDATVLNGRQVSHQFKKPGFYDVNLTVKNPVSACINSFTIDSMIKVFPTPVAHFHADADHCYPGEVLLVYTHQTDSSYCTWETGGNPVAGFDNDSFLMNIYHPVENVKLTVSEFGCVGKPFNMLLKRQPEFDFSVDNEEGCQPLAVFAEAYSSDPQLSYSWFTDSVPMPGISNRYFFADTGNFDIGLIATSLQTGCRDTLVKQDIVYVHRKPFAKFEVDYPVALLDNAEVSFINYAERARFYNWDFGDGESSSEYNPVHKYHAVGAYQPVQIVETEFGCTDTFTLKINILPSQSFVPNAFRPNSEIAENRTFMPVGPGVDETDFSLKIYSRSGELVFESNSPFNPWTGKNRDEKDVPQGNYVWVTNYTDVQGRKRSEKGQVILLR